jgi:ABC-2 type transport system ATP-binding protein
VILEVRGLGKDYGARTAVRAIDLDVARGEIVGLLGPNGAGKTTTISMISGVVTPDRGTARVAGHDVRTDARAARAALGVVPQDLAIYEPLTPVENLSFFGALYGLAGARLRERIDWALGVAGLADRADEPATRFSGGMKRRLNIAAGLLHQPTLVVFDEPTVGVDPHSRSHIFATIRALRDGGMTILYTSHYMEEVEALCDRVAIMDGGALVAQGTVAELLAGHGDAAIEVALDDGRAVTLDGDRPLAPQLAELEASGAAVRSIATRRVTLETVFLELTGKTLRDQ